MRNRAFTLIELLVVIGIIALLASIALPAFRSAMESAHGTQDASNLRQLGIGIVAYLGDHDDTIFTTASLSGSSWAVMIGPGSSANYVSDYHVFVSPFDKRGYSSATPQRVSYGMNQNILALTSTSSTTTSFHYPSSLMVLGPNAGSVSGAPSFLGTMAVPNSMADNFPKVPGLMGDPGAKVGSGLLNALFLDGHVSKMNASDFDNASFNMSTGTPAKSQFWNPDAG